MDFFTQPIRVSHSAYRRDRVNPITGEPMPLINMPKQKATSATVLKTVQDLLVDPPSAFNEILTDNRPIGDRGAHGSRTENTPKHTTHDEGAAGEGRTPFGTVATEYNRANIEFNQNREIQLGWTAYSKKMATPPVNQNKTSPSHGLGAAGEGRQSRRTDQGWVTNSMKMQPPIAKLQNPIPPDVSLASTYHSKLTNKVTEDLTGADCMSIEERLARIQLKSLRPPLTPPSPYRMGRLHQPNAGKHVLETPWDLLPDEDSINRAHPRRESGIVTKEVMDQNMLDLTEMMRESDEGKDDTLLVQLNQSWVDPAYSALQQQKKRSKEDMQSKKVRHIVEEVIMVDQLSRSPISSPEQASYHCNTVEPAYRPGMKRGTIRTLHESSVDVSGICTEKVLTKGKVYFCARILTRNGRDAIREITGFYFTIDNSLTLYEHREFSSKTNVTALPFIKRRVYSHVRGCRKGAPYSITDIVQGNNLEIKTEDQPVPDSMKEKPCAFFRITEVDNEAKSKILLDGLPAISRDEMWKRLHLPPTEGEVQLCRMQKDMRDLIQNQIRYCGVRIWRNMDKVMRKLDTNNTGYLTKYELEKILALFNIEVPSQMFNNLWSFIDEDNTGKMEYEEFRRIFIGEMSEPRKYEMKKAFRKMDFNKKGIINISDMQKFYNAYKHPKVVKGQCIEEQVMENFLIYFSDTVKKGQVTFSEFEEYYEGLSLSIEKDEHFINILQNSWSI